MRTKKNQGESDNRAHDCRDAHDPPRVAVDDHTETVDPAPWLDGNCDILPNPNLDR
jgi:hypothetical protein